jgi:hypothetical protein
MWSCCRSMYCTCLALCVVYTEPRSVLEPIAKPSHAEVNVLREVFGNIRAIFVKQVQLFLNDFVSFRCKLGVKHRC